MSSRKTGVLIRNATPYVVRLGISEIDNFDWDGVSRPDKNIDGRVLISNQAMKEREEINAVASKCMYQLTFYFDNGDSIRQRFDQKKALGKFQDNQVFIVGKNQYTITAESTDDKDLSRVLNITVS